MRIRDCIDERGLPMIRMEVKRFRQARNDGAGAPARNR